MKKVILCTLLFFSVTFSKAQSFGIGASTIYNFQTESLAGGIRAEFPMHNLSIVPQFSYYPSFNKIHEYYVGVALHQNLFRIKNWTFYALIHGGYNGWINYTVSNLENAKYANWDLEGGIGIKTSRCFRPFLEYRYNLKWKETHLHFGFMYFFHCKNNKRFGSSGGGRARKGNCNAYD